jgi:hypothetical protein
MKLCNDRRDAEEELNENRNLQNNEDAKIDGRKKE